MESFSYAVSELGWSAEAAGTGEKANTRESSERSPRGASSGKNSIHMEALNQIIGSCLERFGNPRIAVLSDLPLKQNSFAADTSAAVAQPGGILKR